MLTRLKFYIKNKIKQIPQIKKIYKEKKELEDENNNLKKRIETIIIKEKLLLKKKYFNLDKINKKGPVVLVSKPIAYTFPLSYAYLAGYLKENDEDVRIIFKHNNYKLLAKEIISLNPIIVGFGSLYPELQEISNIIDALNEEGRDFPIVIGGQMVSPIPEFALKITGSDFGIIGEAEITLFNLVKSLREKKDVTKIKGLAIRNNEDVIVTGPGEYIEDLSKLPNIPYDMFPSEQWLNIGRWYTSNNPSQPHWRFNDRVINVHGGRGCPFSCNFCYHHNKARYRPVELMMAEAKRALDKFNGNMLYFSDDLVLATPKRTRELIDAIKQLKQPIKYSMSTRFDILDRIDDNLLMEMKESGCRIMGLGIESGSDRMLKIIGKNTTSEKILYNLERLKKVGILPTVSIMIGQFSETKEDVEMSINLMKESVRMNPNIAYAFTITTPYPGSELYDIIFQKGYLKDHLEFYELYFNNNRNGDWNQVVNLSNMTNSEVVEYHQKIKQIYLEEKTKGFNRKTIKKLDKIEKKQMELSNKNDSIIIIKKVARPDLEKKIFILEEKKLKLRGLL